MVYGTHKKQYQVQTDGRESTQHIIQANNSKTHTSRNKLVLEKNKKQQNTEQCVAMGDQLVQRRGFFRRGEKRGGRNNRESDGGDIRPVRCGADGPW